MTPKAQGMVFWTNERIEEAKRLWVEGWSASQIAKKLGAVTRNAVIGKLHRLGLQRSAPARREAMRMGRNKASKRARLPSPAGGALRVSVQGKVFAVPASQPLPEPRVEDVTAAKPWLERAFGECAYPVSGEGADTFSCCRKVRDGARYCEDHILLMFRPQTPAQRKETRRAGEVLARRVA